MASPDSRGAGRVVHRQRSSSAPAVTPDDFCTASSSSISRSMPRPGQCRRYTRAPDAGVCRRRVRRSAWRDAVHVETGLPVAASAQAHRLRAGCGRSVRAADRLRRIPPGARHAGSRCLGVEVFGAFRRFRIGQQFHAQLSLLQRALATAVQRHAALERLQRVVQALIALFIFSTSSSSSSSDFSNSAIWPPSPGLLSADAFFLVLACRETTSARRRIMLLRQRIWVLPQSRLFQPADSLRVQTMLALAPANSSRAVLLRKRSPTAISSLAA